MPDNLIRSLTTEQDLPEELREQLVARALADNTLDIAYRVVDSPLGPLLLAMTDRGLARLAYAVEDHDAVLDDLAKRVSPRILRSDARLDAVARQLDAYFAHARTTFDLPLDLRLVQGFRLHVLDHLREIPFGTTESYTEVAAAAGSPRAVRAVGTACATNPMPIVIPCHRVVRSDRSMGGYLGGVEAKRFLLELESAA
jgi:methylated-DNA-[protein]-cysteine S-methyltransferase